MRHAEDFLSVETERLVATLNLGSQRSLSLDVTFKQEKITNAKIQRREQSGTFQQLEGS